MSSRRTLLAALLAALLSGCGSSQRPAPAPGRPASIPSEYLLSARPAGRGPRFRPSPLSAAVSSAAPLGRLRCGAGATAFAVHVELFAANRVLVVPAGIGIAPPHVRDGAYVRGGRCDYPLRTREPTGLVEVAAGPQLRLADLFALWGQPLSRHRLATFRARAEVLAYVGGRRWRGRPGDIPLRRHAQIVLEAGPRVPPHASYRFPPGL